MNILADDSLDIHHVDGKVPPAIAAENKLGAVGRKPRRNIITRAKCQPPFGFGGFGFDGKNFISESDAQSWGGHLRSQEFWTVEEGGVYTVGGDSLTITPRASKATLRNQQGVIQKSQNNPLEPMTYRWEFHYFEGLNETQLILQPSRQTNRDGGVAGNSRFPNSYLFSQNTPIEWRY